MSKQYSNSKASSRRQESDDDSDDTAPQQRQQVPKKKRVTQEKDIPLFQRLAADTASRSEQGLHSAEDWSTQQHRHPASDKKRRRPSADVDSDPGKKNMQQLISSV